MRIRFLDRLPRPDPEKEAQRRKDMENVKVSWKDKLAMVVTAYVVLLLPALLILGGICLLVLWLFGAL